MTTQNKMYLEDPNEQFEYQDAYQRQLDRHQIHALIDELCACIHRLFETLMED